MDIARVIRTLGYVVWVAIWSPVIVLTMVVAPIFIVLTSIFKRYWTVGDGLEYYREGLRDGIRRDLIFVRTGEWN